MKFQLRDLLALQLAQSDGELITNISPWLSKATLDMIGLAGMGFFFFALREY